MLNYLYLILLIGWVFLVVGVMIREKLLVALCGFVLVVTGIFMVTNGLGGVNNNVTEVFGVINAVVGSVFFLKYGAEELENIKI